MQVQRKKYDWVVRKKKNSKKNFRIICHTKFTHLTEWSGGGGGGVYFTNRQPRHSQSSCINNLGV